MSVKLLEESIDFSTLSFLIIDGDDRGDRVRSSDDDEVDEFADPMLILMKKQEQQSNI